MGKKEFAAAAVNLEHETYVIHVASLSSIPLAFLWSTSLDVHPFRRSQILGLIVEEVPTKIPTEYLDFADICSPDLASELSKHTEINNHAIELVNGQ